MWSQTRIRADTPTNMTPLLALYCHPNDPIPGTVLPPTQTIIVPICIRYIDQPMAPIRLLSRPDRTIASIRLRSTDQMIVPVRLRSTDQMIVPVRLRLTDRLIDELYAWPLSLPPLVPYLSNQVVFCLLCFSYLAPSYYCLWRLNPYDSPPVSYHRIARIARIAYHLFLMPVPTLCI